jgi:hypothetical protein
VIESSHRCGAVKLEIQAAPEEVKECNCSICRRCGALWAYYAPAQVRIIATKGAIDCYCWGDKSIGFHRCLNCGCVTHWAAFDPHVAHMGGNARLMAPEVLAAARLRHSDGANV